MRCDAMRAIVLLPVMLDALCWNVHTDRRLTVSAERAAALSRLRPCRCPDFLLCQRDANPNQFARHATRRLAAPLDPALLAALPGVLAAVADRQSCVLDAVWRADEHGQPGRERHDDSICIGQDPGDGDTTGPCKPNCISMDCVSSCSGSERCIACTTCASSAPDCVSSSL